jgi:hypothetical protein
MTGLEDINKEVQNKVLAIDLPLTHGETGKT